MYVEGWEKVCVRCGGPLRVSYEDEPEESSNKPLVLYLICNRICLPLVVHPLQGFA